MSFVLGNSVRVLKVAVKKFSVRPCWSPILLKLQNSTAGVFQWVLKKILEHFSTEQQRIATWELKKKVEILVLIALFESRITEKVQKKQSSDFLTSI